MKQIFDWLRDALKAEEESGCHAFEDGINFGLRIAIDKVDKAEAKWEAVIEQMEEYRAKFDCRICKYGKTEGQVCTKDCTDVLIDGLLEIVRKGGVE